MQSVERWQMAQAYEKKHWQKLAARIVEGRSDLRWYAWKAGRTLRRLEECRIRPGKDAVVAEVGSGPVGQVGFFPASRRFAVDPLMEYFEENEALLRDRPGEVEYVAARGEALPLPDDLCDLVIIDNCLDHCEDPAKVLSELRRVTRPEGHLYLTLNVRSPAGWVVRKAAESFLHADQGHPHSYHRRGLCGLVEDAGFRREGGWIQPWADSFREEWGHGPARALTKTATLILERLYEGVWKKE